MPISVFIVSLALKVGQRGSLGERLRYFLYVMLPCIVCGFPAAVLFLVPALVYLALAFANSWVAPTSLTRRAAWMRWLGEAKWLRRMLIVPVAVGWWTVVARWLPLSPVVMYAGIHIAFGIALLWSMYVRARNRQAAAMLQEIVDADRAGTIPPRRDRQLGRHKWGDVE